MSDPYQEFAQCLQDLVTVYQHLLATVEEERVALVAFDIPKISEINAKKEALLEKTSNLEKNRRRLASAIQRFFKKPIEATTLLSLAALYDDEKKEYLVTAHKTLDLLLKRLRELNKIVDGLTRSAQKILDTTIRSVNGGGPASTVYGKQGTLDSGNIPGKFVSKEV